METFWYCAVTLMLAVYVVLDGYDFGVGMLYPFLARTEEERRMVLAAIGPVWNGNEVWLIAGGAVLFLAFPRAYAAGFIGFYLALTIVLWLLIGRGLAIELRGHLDHPLWRSFWDMAFAAASTLLAIVFGTALGHLIRSVPLNAEGDFVVALWNDFLPGPDPGILDCFTVRDLRPASRLLVVYDRTGHRHRVSNLYPPRVPEPRQTRITQFISFHSISPPVMFFTIDDAVIRDVVFYGYSVC